MTAEAGSEEMRKTAQERHRGGIMSGWTEGNVREAFPQDALRLAASGERFVVFPDEGRVLKDEEYDDWCRENDLLSETRRYGFIPIAKRGVFLGYAVNAVGKASLGTSLTIPADMLKGSAEEVVSGILNDLGITTEKRRTENGGGTGEGAS